MVAAQMKVEISCETMKVESSSKYFGVCFSGEADLQSYVKMRVGEGLKSFGVMEKKTVS